MSRREPTVVQAVSLSDLQPGIKLPAPIYDARNPTVLLLGVGMRLSPENLERLKSRGISQVAIEACHLAEVCLEKPASEPASQNPTGPPDLRKLANQPLRSLLRKPPRTPCSQQTVHQQQARRTQQSTQVRQMMDSVQQLNTAVQAQPLKFIAHDSMEMILDDVDVFVKLAIEPPKDSATHEHCLRTAQLAMAIATVLGHKVDDIQQVGVGCLISRVGMTAQGMQLTSEQRRLSGADHVEIQKTPCRTFDLLQEAPDIPMVARQVAYQMFERWDGSGYPRGRAGAQIHPLACVAAVADVYVALSSPRPHRPPFTPYRAIEQLIADTRKGLFDPTAIRGLLKVVCLFPLGTYVELNDGTIGCVTRNNLDNYDRPVLELICDGERRSKTGESLDLAEQLQLNVVRVLEAIEVADIIQACKTTLPATPCQKQPA